MNPIYATKPASYVSDNYKFYPTSEILANLQAQGWKEVKTWFPKSRTSVGTQRHIIEMERNDNGDFEVKYGGLKPRVIITNSHNHTSGLKFQVGFLRVVCSNGLVVGKTTGGFRVTHAKNPFEVVVESIESHAKLLTQSLTIIDQANQILLGESEKEALAIKAIQIRHGLNYELSNSTIADFLRVRRQDDYTDTLWNVFNRVQETMIGGQYMSNSNRLIKPSRNLGMVNHWNASLWDATFNEEFLTR